MSWINPFTTKREDVHPLAQIDYDLSVLLVVSLIGLAGAFLFTILAATGVIPV